MSKGVWRAWSAPLAALALVAAAGSGCRSAGKAQGPRAAGPTRVDPLAGWAGQTRILRHRGDDAKWSIKRQDLRSASGECDVAVEVRQARFSGGTASFALEMIGRPRLVRRGAHQERCGSDQAEITLSVSGFDAGASAADLETALAEVLQTPEGYLRAHAVKFEVPAVPAAAAQGPASIADHQLTRKPTRLMWVDAITRDPRGKIHHEAEVEFDAVVGPDGILREPHVSTGLSEEHEKRILRVLPLWRFDPARKGAEPAAARVSERMVFRIY
jgi:hypothetical protein